MAVVAGSLRRGSLAAWRGVVLVASGLAMSGCASLSDLPLPGLSEAKPIPAPSDTPQVAQSDLQKATEYWGKEFSKKPTDIDAALAYAKNLKALGQKQQALNVLQQASLFHAADKRLNSEYGRLALELDQVGTAEKMLAAADDAVSPDWRVISARGTVLAKQGRYAEAIPLYERALQLSADQPSVLNNLALAHAMNGDAAQAEEVLRRATASGAASPKVRQNLALVLGLQGKYDEATKVGTEASSAAAASANTDMIKQIVKLPAKPYGEPTQGTWQPVVAVAQADSPTAWQTRIKTPSQPAAPLKATAPVSAAITVPVAPVASAAPEAALRPSAN
jgi:Flp pilus assembly protein TadD